MKLHKAIADINLKALSHNLRVVRKKTGNKNILAVVKADAYGHGAQRVSESLIRNGVSMLGVAFTHEGIALRESGIKTPILVFFDRNNADACIEYNLTPVIYDFNEAKKIQALSKKQKISMPVHIKVDTGMGRVGIVKERAFNEILKISKLANLEPEGIMSHFSDADLQSKNFAIHQQEVFRSLISALKKEGITFKFIHMANSAAVLTMPDAHFNMVRPGIMLYGYGCCEKEELRPVMTLKSRIILLKNVPKGTSISYGRTFITRRKSTIATIPVGYADGYNRKLSNNAEVLIKGRRAPVAGRVCMDTIMADVTDIPGVNYRSEVVLIGTQGNEKITADDIAEKIGTIPYEILTSVGTRVKRVYT
ncbi:MAG: alanine racemase [Nitrospiraceae bacterium]|nr:MAG: alanine racemase [Nitrospiraceae bacterium]